MFGALEFACPLRPHVGERTTAPAIAPARSPPLALNRQQLAAPEWVFEAIPERRVERAARLFAQLRSNAGLARIIPIVGAKFSESFSLPYFLISVFL